MAVLSLAGIKKALTGPFFCLVEPIGIEPTTS